MSLLDRVRYLLPAAILLLVSVFILFYNVGDRPLHDWDEGIYTTIAAEMVESGEWFDMTLMGQPWLEKPVFPFWLNAVAFKWFGFTEFAARFFPALAGVGAVLLLFGIGRRLFSWYVGFWAALLFALSPLFLDYHMARSADHDVLFLFWFLLSIYAFIRSWKKKDHYFWTISGIAAGFAIFTRGALGLFAVLIPVLSHVIFVAKSRVRGTKLDNRYSWQRWVAWAISWVFIGGAWHIYAYLNYGQQFIDVYIIEQFFSRISGPLQGHTGPWWSYAKYLWNTIPFVSVSALSMMVLWLTRYAAAHISPKKLSKIHFTPGILLLMVWLFVFGVALVVMETKLNWYVLGAVPALFIIAASALNHIGAPRAFATVGVVALLVFYGLQLPHRTNESAYEFKNVLAELSQEQELIVYKAQQWNFGRILPATYWYLKYSAQVTPTSIDKAGLEHYLDRYEYGQWLTTEEGLSDLQEYKELASFEQKRYGEHILLQRPGL